ncbi:MAG: hypothetical protein F6K31_25835 [Symploca sp. SIO2G7]|nr:hypothetical protein [Symploca sp. SIO2G7]
MSLSRDAPDAGMGRWGAGGVGEAPVHKYLIRPIRTINSNAGIVKSYHFCLLPFAFYLPSQVSFRQACKI